MGTGGDVYGQVVLIVVTRPRGQTPDGGGYRGRICISPGSPSLTNLILFSRPGSETLILNR